MSPRKSPSPGRARVGVAINFFTNGLTLALLPRFPEVKQAFDLGDGVYGLMVAGMGLGAIAAFHLPARFISRYGPLKVSLVGMWAMSALLVVAGFAPHPLVFFLALFGMGFFDSAVDSAQNVQGVVVQIWSKRTIINSLHATWSVGATFAGLVGSAAAGLRIPLWMQNLAVAGLILTLSVVCYRLGTVPADVAAAQRADRAERAADAPPSLRRLWPVVPLALIALCGVLPEDLTNNWGAVFLGREFALDAGAAGLGLVTMLVAQVVGRFAADPMTDRFGGFQVAAAGSLLIAGGAGALILTPQAWGAYVGFALMGFGSASLVPTAFAAAGQLPGVAPGTGITVVSLMMRVAFTASSPAIGGVAELAGLRTALLIPLIAGVVAAGLAWARRERPAPSTRTI